MYGSSIDIMPRVISLPISVSPTRTSVFGLVLFSSWVVPMIVSEGFMGTANSSGVLRCMLSFDDDNSGLFFGRIFSSDDVFHSIGEKPRRF